jgi:hypothetical protein
MFSVANPDVALPEINVVVPTIDVIEICRSFQLHDVITVITQDEPEYPFKSDGCSMWPDTWIGGQSIYAGCFVHDIFYWCGRKGDALSRFQADSWLSLWVAQNVSVGLAEKMLAGVRVGGAEWLNAPWSWAYGRTGAPPRVNATFLEQFIS